MILAAFRQSAPVATHWQARALFASAEKALEAERGQLAPWWVVALGVGVALWLVLADPSSWRAAEVCLAGLALLGLATGGRLGRSLALFSLAVLLGLGLIWWRSHEVAAPRPADTRILAFEATVLKAERLAAKDALRLTVAPADASLPPRVRVSMPLKDAAVFGTRLGAGTVVRLKARLTPPTAMVLPGSYDFARDTWFKGLRATGRTLGPVTLVHPAAESGLDSIRRQLDAHVRSRLDAAPAGIATALVTGDQGSVLEEDAEAMRRAGLAHLLSVSGLHIAAAVGFAYFLVLRLFGLFPPVALRFNLVIAGIVAGALAGIGYTVLTGLQVPTVRSCIAALLVLVGVVLGREALSIRLIACGALIVLLVWPEALAGASFQLSFAVVTALVTHYASTVFKRAFERREESMPAGGLRGSAP